MLDLLTPGTEILQLVLLEGTNFIHNLRLLSLHLLAKDTPCMASSEDQMAASILTTLGAGWPILLVDLRGIFVPVHGEALAGAYPVVKELVHIVLVPVGRVTPPERRLLLKSPQRVRRWLLKSCVNFTILFKIVF